MKSSLFVSPGSGKGRFNVTFTDVTAEQALRLTAPIRMAPAAGPAPLPKPRKVTPRKAKPAPSDEPLGPKVEPPAKVDGPAKAFLDCLKEAGEAGLTFDQIKEKFEVNDLRKIRAHIVGARNVAGNSLEKTETGYRLK